MIVLVDFDNVNPLDRGRGLTFLAERIASSLGPEHLRSETSLDFSFYGGWFDEGSLTRLAQELAAESAREFPRRIALSDESGSIQLKARARIAYGIAGDQSIQFTHTYRRRSLPPKLSCKPHPIQECRRQSTCQLEVVRKFIEEEACPVDGCTACPDDLLFRPEQKLVDAMILTDLLHFSIDRNDPLCIVSADDDFWPAIRYSLARGRRVFHVYPKSGWKTPAHYAPPSELSYTQVAF